MVEFAVEVVKVVIEEHPNADRLEIAQVGDFKCVVMKDQFKTGDLAVYIPESSIVPEELLRELNLWDSSREPERGKLSGKQGNRVKPIRLRGVFSEGICITVNPTLWKEGDDIAEELGITKYEPPIPMAFKGQRDSCPFPLNFEIENIKKRYQILEEGEMVVYTEKIHGTFMAVGVVAEADRKEHMIDGKYIVSSKGLIKRGTYIKDVEENALNGYMQVAKRLDIGRKLEKAIGVPKSGVNWILGEVYGVQKGYRYGCTGNDTGYRVFDIKLNNEYMDFDILKSTCCGMMLLQVPVLATEPFYKSDLKILTDGTENVSGNRAHIREGVVVKPVVERRDSKGNRVCFKSVSEKYLLKTTGDEFN